MALISEQCILAKIDDWCYISVCLFRIKISERRIKSQLAVKVL